MANDEHDRPPRAWIIRAGRFGEREDFNLEHGLASCGWGDIPDLRSVESRGDLERTLGSQLPNAREKAVTAWANQLWRLREQVRIGDMVAMPLKTTSQIAFGIVTRPYWFNAEDDPGWRHVVSVDWRRTDVPRTAVKQDLLYALGGALTIFTTTRNDGQWRLRQLLETGVDPGARSARSETDHNGGVSSADEADDGESETAGTDTDLEQVGRDRIRSHIVENFAGHKLSHLVAKLLQAEGFTVDTAAPGPDGGIDVFAGQGPLGLDSPRVVVQVKSSPAPVDVNVVRALEGVVGRQGADQGLLVASGGITQPARREMRSQFFRVRVWDADDLIDALFRNYDKLGKVLQAELPLKRIWTLVED